MSAARSRPELHRLCDRFLEAQLRGDRRAALDLVRDAIGQGTPIPDLHEHVLREAQRQIGVLWQENRVSIAQEHMATAIANLVLSQLFETAARAPRNGVAALVACVEGELHEFPARLVADALDLGGFEVRYLGASVPTDSLLEMIATEQPRMVALSATMTFHLPALASAIERIRAAHGATVAIAVGGGALAWAPVLSRRLAGDVDIQAASAAELVLAAARHFGLPTGGGAG